MRRPWTEVAAAKRAEREAHLKNHSRCRIDPSAHAQITQIDNVAALTDLLEKGSISAEDVVVAYIDKACQAQEETNCLTEICFDDAIAQARALDAFRKKEGRLKGPLHGVPMSLKDQFNIKGFDSTLGYIGRAFKPADSDALLVHVLKELGAVIIAKTNLPQSIMWCETENPIWGLTTHPKNSKLTPGGSSGGEAALLALQGSMVGWGTDIGGSIRIPSHMNGLWGFKPSSGRLSYQGVEVSTDGQQHVPSAVGPMARSLDSLIITTKAVINMGLWNLDALLPPVPWAQDVLDDFSQKRLVIGAMLDDGVVKVHPPIARVFEETVSRLRKAGHEIVEWDTSLNTECISIMDQYYTADGGEDIRREVTEGGEPFLPHVEALVNRAPAISVYEYWQLNKKKIAAQQAYLQMWNNARAPSERPVDILLVPTMPHTAVPHRSCRWVGYTKLFNFLDYPALSFPAGKVTKGLDPDVLPEVEPRNPLDAWNWQTYDLDLMDGLDIGLQIVGRRLEEEKVLGAALQVRRLMESLP
ncbi:hypothetical protein A1O1_07260 [Capronia coronata CBS 617.96]|uniref:amidase n=1 Tax=Capronia coronata CBS 617.96 TaxID=1182541 RepID=W9Y312_9EURO|nr:uncharacterized protein A1O1_07260 [Capronia coronata CBS 617.96]EXJ83636.1 hypothetical protein A1O1_07260 [Capronia coronata CBS 617.96]